MEVKQKAEGNLARNVPDTYSVSPLILQKKDIEYAIRKKENIPE